MTKSIPKASTPKKIIPSLKDNLREIQNKNEKIVFSFSLFKQDEYFNVTETKDKWISSLLETLREISNIDIKRFNTDMNFRDVNRIHGCGDALPPCNPPHNISLEDLTQIGLGTSKGRIHGVLIENIFYIVLADPFHYMYPGENHTKPIKRNVLGR